MRTSVLRGFLLASTLAVAAACGGGDGDGGGGGGDDGSTGTATAGGDVSRGSLRTIRAGGGNDASAEIELAPAARTVAAATVDEALVDVTDGVYRLDGDADLGSIEPGSVVLFEEHSLVRILEMRQEGGEVVLVTEPAPLNDYIIDGEIGWDYQIDFDTSRAQHWSQGMNVFLGPLQLQPAEWSETALKFTGEIGSLAIEIEIKPAGQRLEISLKGTKNVAGQALLVEVSGWVEGFRSTGNIQYSGGELQQFRYENRELKGQLNIHVVGTRLGQEPEIFRLPLRLDMPFVVYGIPMTLSLGANLSVTPELTGESSSEVEFNVTYSGSQGFAWSQTSASALGGLDNQVLDMVTGDTAGFGPVGLGVTLAFPVMQLSILHGTVVPSMVIDTHVSGFYSPDPACQSALIRLRVVVGISLGVLGFELASVQQTIFEKEREIEDGPGCASFSDE